MTDADGTVHNYAGTHGNCDITNCIGSPRDRVSLAATWDFAPWRLGLNVNYRGEMSNKFEQSDTDCAQTIADGADFPSGCKVKSFTTADLSGAWKFGKNSEIFGSIQNVFDAKPPVGLRDLRRHRLQPARLLGRHRPLLPHRGEAPVLRRVPTQTPPPERTVEFFLGWTLPLGALSDGERRTLRLESRDPL